MKVAAVLTDLMLYSRIESAARASGADLVRVDSPAAVPADADLVLVDWAARGPGWADALSAIGRLASFSSGRTRTWKPTQRRAPPGWARCGRGRS